MQSYSQCEQLLDVETVGGGVFRPDVTDPEMSQACSTSLWELVLLRVWDLLLPVYMHNGSTCHMLPVNWGTYQARSQDFQKGGYVDVWRMLRPLNPTPSCLERQSLQITVGAYP